MHDQNIKKKAMAIDIITPENTDFKVSGTGIEIVGIGTRHSIEGSDRNGC